MAMWGKTGLSQEDIKLITEQAMKKSGRHGEPSLDARDYVFAGSVIEAYSDFLDQRAWPSPRSNGVMLES